MSSIKDLRLLIYYFQRFQIISKVEEYEQHQYVTKKNTI